jgi:hypothetical protein
LATANRTGRIEASIEAGEQSIPLASPRRIQFNPASRTGWASAKALTSCRQRPLLAEAKPGMRMYAI